MSQSPDDASQGGEKLQDYRAGWSALNQLIGQGRSFSGRERNCCFLNAGNGDGRFADVSAATGADLAEDGRAVALADWDFDGDVDLWLANRTAPRVRLLRNDTAAGHRFLALRLRGTTCNRDAIGARVELHLAGSPKRALPRTLIRTLRAGEGYLAQSSKWLHFGLGDNENIEKLVVRWPGGTPQTFSGVTVDAHYDVVQGDAAPRRWNPPRRAWPPTPARIALPKDDAASRTLLVGRPVLPDAKWIDVDGATQPIDALAGRAVLVNLWSRMCAPCRVELVEWQRDREAIQSAGGSVLALCVDGLAENATDPAARASAMTASLADMNVKLPHGLATRELIAALQTVHNAYVELQLPLPVPCSFLVDDRGRLAAIYKGRLSTEQLLVDLHALADSPHRRRDAAVPFAGRWASQPFRPTPHPVLQSLLTAGDETAAIAYLRRFAARAADYDDPTLDDTIASAYRNVGAKLIEAGHGDAAADLWADLLASSPRDPSLHTNVGQALFTAGAFDSAARHFERAIAANPLDADLHLALAMALAGGQRPLDAIERLEHALKLQPGDVRTLTLFGDSLYAAGRARDAIQRYREALRAKPDWLPALNNLAWILATIEDEQLRDPAEAVRLAELAASGSRRGDPALLSTLAAAYAAAARFDDAVRTTQQVIDAARRLERHRMVQTQQTRLEQFENEKPLRIPVSTAATGPKSSPHESR